MRRLPPALIALVVVIAVAVTVWFVTRSAPEQVSIASAVEQVSSDGSTEAADGAWTVDTSVGEFSVEDTTGTFVGFRVDEELARIGATTAVGRTPAVTGGIELDGTTLTAATLEADLTEVISDQSRRDDAIQRALETGTYPTATFTLTEPVELGALTADQSVEVTATGDLTIHGQTNSVEVPLAVSLTDGVAVVTSTFPVTFSDYDVQVPTAPIVVSVEDSGLVELQLFLTPA